MPRGCPPITGWNIPKAYAAAKLGLSLLHYLRDRLTRRTPPPTLAARIALRTGLPATLAG